MKILITGGAGYIGSHVAAQLADHDVRILDLKNGDDVRDYNTIAKYVSGCDAVVHCAGLKSSSESVLYPDKYHDYNVNGTVTLIRAMRNYFVKHIIFSSSAAVYQASDQLLRESSTCEPSTPYGESKLLGEKAIQLSGLDYTIFRFFNVAGGSVVADQSADNLFPRLMRNHNVTIYGNNYPTPDGTCVRDYIHVDDIARAHVMAAESGKTGIFNLGTGQGASVLEVVYTLQSNGYSVDSLTYEDRRPGDPAQLVADLGLANSVLGWIPKYDLNDIARSAIILSR